MRRQLTVVELVVVSVVLDHLFEAVTHSVLTLVNLHHARSFIIWLTQELLLLLRVHFLLSL